jgi:polyisoprenoid-binding protein YceI
MSRWNLDPVHSEVKFRVKHLVIASVTGNFTKFTGWMETEKEDFTDGKIYFEADVNSLTTNHEQRDAHLRTNDFFDAANHPKLTFRSKNVSKKKYNEYVVTGDITIRGITKEVKLDVVYNGMVKGFGGVETAGFEIAGKFNRHDFGIAFNALTEAGHLVVGEEVKIELTAEVQKEAPHAELKKAA